MKTVRLNIPAQETSSTIVIPEEFRDEELYVTITAFAKERPRRKVRVRDLLGVAKDPGITLEEMRYERLMARG